MGIEIERKFLLCSTDALIGNGKQIHQGYLRAGPVSVRVRITRANDVAKATITVKGPMIDAARAEFEYAVPTADAEAMMGLCVGPPIEKNRHKLHHAGHDWDVDIFTGVNAPLMLAEVELTSKDENVELPNWVGEEVTSDGRYQNAYLAEHPFSTWDA